MESPPFWMWIVGFLLVLGPLVTVHELGHYLVGRWFGVKADAFSIGFGKEMFGWTDKRGTRWKVSNLPLGGYVQFAGDMNPASQPSEEWLKLPPEERNKTFQSKPLWQRALIVAAGPVTNFLVAIAIFAAFFMVLGKVADTEPGALQVSEFTEDSAGAKAGMKVGDKLLSIDGEPVTGFQDVLSRLVLYPGETVQIELEREGQELTLPVTIAPVVETDQFGNESRIGRIGVMFALDPAALKRESVGPVEAVSLAVEQTGTIVKTMVVGLKQIILGDRSVKELGGPIKIAKFSGEQLSLGWESYVAFVAMISINLAFINLLPIPALDGGHLAFYAAEAVRRKPVSPRSQEWAFRSGMALVLALMLFVTINDIASLPIFGS